MRAIITVCCDHNGAGLFSKTGPAQCCIEIQYWVSFQSEGETSAQPDGAANLELVVDAEETGTPHASVSQPGGSETQAPISRG